MTSHTVPLGLGYKYAEYGPKGLRPTWARTQRETEERRLCMSVDINIDKPLKLLETQMPNLYHCIGQLNGFEQEKHL